MNEPQYILFPVRSAEQGYVRPEIGRDKRSNRIFDAKTFVFDLTNDRWYRGDGATKGGVDLKSEPLYISSADARYLRQALNLSDLPDKLAARTALDVYSKPEAGLMADWTPYVSPPAGSWWATPGNFDNQVIRRPDGTFELARDFDAYWETATRGLTVTELFIDAENGDDVTGDGLTWGTAWKTLAKPGAETSNWTSVQAVILNIRGTFDWLAMWSITGVDPAKPLMVRGHGEARVAVSVAASTITWTQESSPNTDVWGFDYSAQSAPVGARTPNGVYDPGQLDAFGDYTSYSSAESIEECQASPQSFFLDTVNSKFYVHTATDPSSTSAAVSVDRCGLALGTNAQTFLDSITIEGGWASIITGSSTTMQSLFYRRCKFTSTFPDPAGVQSGNAMNFTPSPNGLCIGWDSIATKAWKDGFSYSGTNTVVEVRNIGRSNGVDVAGTAHNGTTGHGAIRALLLSGQYYKNLNRNVHYVQTSTLWAIGCAAGDATTDLTDADQSVDWFVSFTGGGVTAWLDRCVRFGNSLHPLMVIDGTVRVRNCNFQPADFTGGGSAYSY
ncbi:hypothetical protein H5P28_11825 [Ruficoccus amylovorans]|uniref:Uncharacterized protein n=1 Tax=Ruficoccus amylovorans TaxID=1804625 RepID=A0A842HH47_9BACT|nr:hypothetical protein [Ruficoccus amylovorans]MBC2594946.1 hypothetical protein [Ruficoccus amylovorans]